MHKLGIHPRTGPSQLSKRWRELISMISQHTRSRVRGLMSGLTFFQN
jgi:hypothetical protein